MLRQPFVDKGVIRGQQIQDAAILANHAAEEQFHFVLVGRPQVVVEIGKQIHHRLATLERPYAQPLASEVGDQRFRFRIRQHAPHLLVEYGWILELALCSQVDQFVVGNAAPQEKGQPRSQRQIVDAVVLAGSDAGWFQLAAIYKFRIHQHPLKRRFDAVIECSAVAAASLIKLHQSRQISWRGRPAVRMLHQC